MNGTIANPLLGVRGLTMEGPGGLRILDDVSFDVGAGEIVALVGESGSGKTMAARSALRLVPPQVRRIAGEVLFEGRDVDSLGAEAMRRLRGGSIGMIFQEPMVSLNPAMTIGAQLAEGLMLHRKVSAAEADSLACAMLARVQIKDPKGCLSAYPHQFSGGMRQRIMLASVMLLKPKLLIADEPTTALDTLSQREVLRLMVELTRTEGTAVLLITHNLGLVAQYAHKVVVLQRGRLVERGGVAEVLTRPRQAYTRALLDALPRREDNRAPVPDAPALIEAREVSVRFPGSGGMFSSTPPKLAVDGVSLAVRPGEAVAVVGGSGSGKTTLGRAMIGLLPLASGEVAFRGGPMAGAGRSRQRDFRLNCQLVFQDPYSSLDPRQRIGDIVAEPLSHGPRLGRAERRERVEAILAEVGLAGFAERFPHALSGGQRQRVAIARAVIRNPAFVVADEPVSALDMTIQKQVLELFRRLQDKHGFACLFISHDMAAVSQVADRIVVMKDGRIVEQGSVAEIFDRPQHTYTRALLEATPSLAVPQAMPA
ncbi:ABC transporter ATP-binding protein [Labrys sp. (in: a-proteobacteria)]|uniref:ABC transporter ATP-binding protein n=1 Tax=Labrys sp. (in: a-proteobacteria) TaxID=1917972 RepID=UPI0039E7102C